MQVFLADFELKELLQIVIPRSYHNNIYSYFHLHYASSRLPSLIVLSKSFIMTTCIKPFDTTYIHININLSISSSKIWFASNTDITVSKTFSLSNENYDLGH